MQRTVAINTHNKWQCIVVHYYKQHVTGLFRIKLESTEITYTPAKAERAC